MVKSRYLLQIPEVKALNQVQGHNVIFKINTYLYLCNILNNTSIDNIADQYRLARLEALTSHLLQTTNLLNARLLPESSNCVHAKKLRMFCPKAPPPPYSHNYYTNVDILTSLVMSRFELRIEPMTSPIIRGCVTYCVIVAILYLTRRKYERFISCHKM